jgi:hypothetical protein
MDMKIYSLIVKSPGFSPGLFTMAGDGGIGHKLLSLLFRFAHKNLSTFDPASQSPSDIAAAFDSSREQSSLPAHPLIILIKKTQEKPESF